MKTLGRGGPAVPPLGVGLWAWGDEKIWRFDPERGPRDAREAFAASVEAGLAFFDTAEIYGGGASERLLGECLRESNRSVFVATKFAPLPWRLTSSALPRALDASLARLGLAAADLYQVHWPWTLLPIARLMERMADAVQAGKVRHVGVSNYSAARMRRAHDALARRGLALASNQVQYNLLDRAPERNGVLEACRELGVTLIAYSPLALGALTGKYAPDRLPAGARRFMGPFRRIARAMPVVEALRRVGAKHGGTPAQVALQWLARQDGVLPIPGARNAAQARENAGALRLTLDDEDLALLDRVSR